MPRNPISALIWGVALSTFVSTSHAKTYVAAALGATHSQERDQVSSSVELTGGMVLLPNFYVEASYLDLGDTLPEQGAYTINVSGVSFAGKAMLPLSERLDFFAKMGFYLWDAKQNFGDITYSTGNGQDMTYGGGLAWRTHQQFDVSLEYKELHLADEPKQQLSLGVTYAF